MERRTKGSRCESLPVRILTVAVRQRQESVWEVDEVRLIQMKVGA